MSQYMLLSTIAFVFLLVANCASATLWISVLGGHRSKWTHQEGWTPDPTTRTKKRLIRMPVCVSDMDLLAELLGVGCRTDSV